METFHRLIIPFLMTTITKTHDNKIRRTKRVTFGWSESVTNKHKHYDGTPCDKSGAFYPRQNRIH